MNSKDRLVFQLLFKCIEILQNRISTSVIATTCTFTRHSMSLQAHVVIPPETRYHSKLHFIYAKTNDSEKCEYTISSLCTTF